MLNRTGFLNIYHPNMPKFDFPCHIGKFRLLISNLWHVPFLFVWDKCGMMISNGHWRTRFGNYRKAIRMIPASKRSIESVARDTQLIRCFWRHPPFFFLYGSVGRLKRTPHLFRCCFVVDLLASHVYVSSLGIWCFVIGWFHTCLMHLFWLCIFI